MKGTKGGEREGDPASSRPRSEDGEGTMSKIKLKK